MRFQRWLKNASTSTWPCGKFKLRQQYTNYSLHDIQSDANKKERKEKKNQWIVKPCVVRLLFLNSLLVFVFPETHCHFAVHK